MPPEDAYSQDVRARFANPVNASELKGAYAVTLTGEAGLTGEPFRVAFTAGIEQDRIREMCFRALGCPHIIAAADLLCSELQGQATGALTTVWANRLMQNLSIPEEKTGRIFLLEDAIKRIGEQYARVEETS